MQLRSPMLDLALAERIGWTLVHSVWQVALVAAAFAVAAFVLRRRSANVRYVLGCVALAAMVAWPADYGSTGIMTFIVNQNGRVYQKDFGEKTEVGAAAIQDYNPDSSWTEVKE